MVFEESYNLVGVSYYNVNYPKRNEQDDEKVKNCPKGDLQNSCWGEIEKLAAKYRASLEFKDTEFETFYANFKDGKIKTDENDEKINEVKCGDFVASGENLDIWKYTDTLFFDKRSKVFVKGEIGCFE